MSTDAETRGKPVLHDSAAFLLLTFGIAWPLWLASGVLGRAGTPMMDLHWWVAQIGVFAPSFAALVVASRLDADARSPAVRTLTAVYLPAAVIGYGVATHDTATFPVLGTSRAVAVGLLGAWLLLWFGRRANRLIPWPGVPATRATVAWWTLGCVAVPALACLLAWMAAGPSAAPADSATGVARDLTPASMLQAWFFNLAFGGSLGEELGWRGFWLPRLLRQRTPLAASMLLGVAWALWHAPIDLAAGFGVSGPGSLLVRLLWTLPIALLFTWVTLRAGGSLLPPLALHTTLNTFPDFVARDPSRLQASMAVLFVLFLAAGVLVASVDQRLRRPSAPA